MRHETAFGDRSREAGLKEIRPLELGAGALRAAVSESAIFANDIRLLADGALTHVTASPNNMEFNGTVDVKLANGEQVGTYSNNMGINYLLGTPIPISDH